MISIGESCIKHYGQDYAVEIDAGAYAHLTEDFTGKTFNKNSIHKGSIGNNLALVTEYYFKKLLKSKGILVEDKSKEHELWDFVVLGRKIDVKSKRRNTKPRIDYDYHVDSSQLAHKCTSYVFSDVFYPDKNADMPVYIGYAGWTSKAEFMQDSTEKKAGDICVVTGFVEKVDCRKLNSWWLHKMDHLIVHMLRLQG